MGLLWLAAKVAVVSFVAVVSACVGIFVLDKTLGRWW